MAAMRMSISVPKELKDRMRDAVDAGMDANWSAIAKRAFEQKLRKKQYVFQIIEDEGGAVYLQIDPTALHLLMALASEQARKMKEQSQWPEAREEAYQAFNMATEIMMAARKLMD